MGKGTQEEESSNVLVVCVDGTHRGEVLRQVSVHGERIDVGGSEGTSGPKRGKRDRQVPVQASLIPVQREGTDGVPKEDAEHAQGKVVMCYIREPERVRRRHPCPQKA